MAALEPGLQLGPTGWLEIDQQRVDRFAAAVEREGLEKPACAAELVLRYLR
jgi:hypothetical protein